MRFIRIGRHTVNLDQIVSYERRKSSEYHSRREAMRVYFSDGRWAEDDPEVFLKRLGEILGMVPFEPVP